MGHNALFLAAKLGNLALLCYLIKEQSMDITSTDLGQSTVLHLAILERREDMVLLILALGGKLDLQDSEGNTALHLAVNSGIYRVIRHLLISGARKDVRNSMRQIPSDLCQNGEISKLMKKSFPVNSIRYFIVVLAYFTLQSIVFAIVDETYGYKTPLFVICGILYVANMLIFLLLCFRAPGYEEKTGGTLQVIIK